MLKRKTQEKKAKLKATLRKQKPAITPENTQSNNTEIQTNYVSYIRSDMGNVDAFLQQYGHVIKYISPWKECIVWNGRCWEQDQHKARCLVQDFVKKDMFQIADNINPKSKEDFKKWVIKSQSIARIDAILKLASDRLTTPVSDLNNKPFLLPMENGVYDLDRLTFREHRPEDMMLDLSPCIYDPDAKCPVFDNFIRRTTSDANGTPRPELQAFLMRVLGYCLSGDVSERKFFIFHGKGSNGKTKLLDILRYILGPYATVAQEQLLLTKQFGKSNGEDEADLYGKRLATVSEPEQNARFADSKVKRLTGEQTITAERKYEHPFTFYMTAKCIMDCNFKPALHGGDFAIRERILMVPFDNIIPENEKDTKLFDKLQNEASGILNRLLDGWHEYKQQGLNPPALITDAVDDYMAENDIVAEFLDDLGIEIKPNKMATKKDMHRLYMQFCQYKGYDYHLGINKLGTQLINKGLVEGFARIGGIKQRVWCNIDITDATITLQKLALQSEAFFDDAHIKASKNIDAKLDGTRIVPEMTEHEVQQEVAKIIKPA